MFFWKVDKSLRTVSSTGPPLEAGMKIYPLVNLSSKPVINIEKSSQHSLQLFFKHNVTFVAHGYKNAESCKERINLA